MVNTRIIMVVSAFILGIIGVLLTFLPDEMMRYFSMPPTPILGLVIQITGSLYFGLAMLNWMSQWSLIGGIYNKPVSVANFAHFFIVAITLVKEVPPIGQHTSVLWILTGLYAAFAITFGWLFFKGPVHKASEQ